MKPTQERIQAVYDGLVSKGRKRITVRDITTHSIFYAGGSLIGYDTEVKQFLNEQKAKV